MFYPLQRELFHSCKSAGFALPALTIIAPYQGVAVAANGKDLKHLYVQHLRSFGQIGHPKKNIEISSRSIYGVKLKLLFIKSCVSSSAF